MASPYIQPQNIPLHIQLEWYKIRDMFCGVNGSKRNIPLALEMASKCTHPDAEWLSSTCAGHVTNTFQAKVCFNLFPHDARAICFSWFSDLSYVAPIIPLYHSATLGYPFAQASFALHTNDDTAAFKFAQLAAKNNERDGFYVLGTCYEQGIGCVVDLKSATTNFTFAANLNHSFAMSFLGSMFKDSDPKRWYWWGLDVNRDEPGMFYLRFMRQVSLFFMGNRNNSAMFQIGKVLRGRVNMEAKQVLNFVSDIEKCVAAQKAVDFYEMQLDAYRKAVDEWTKIGMRFKVVKDIRRFIAQLVWNTRGEALYTLANTPLNNV